MPRYLIERTFPGGLDIPPTPEGRAVIQAIVARNTEDAVTWLHSFVTADRTTTFCLYDGPDPEAIRRTALANSLSVDWIVEVSVLDPYFY